jgi:predicted alpha/beta superfamily hydrolase
MNDQPIPALGSTEVHDLRSEALDDERRIFIAHCGDKPQGILLVTDGNGLFGLVVDTLRFMQIPGLVPSMVVVAVGYPTASTLLDTAQIRTTDLTPTHSPAFEHSGGADNFVKFLTDELGPWLTKRYPRAADDVTYFGHSLGGLFGAHVLLTQPGLFNRYILASPSLWWDRESIFRKEEAFSTVNDDLRASVFFGIGSLEIDEGRRAEAVNLPSGHPFKPPAARLDMVDDMRRFTAQLAGRNYPSLDLRAVEIADEFHATVPGVVLSRALRHFWIHHSATPKYPDNRRPRVPGTRQMPAF